MVPRKWLRSLTLECNFIRMWKRSLLCIRSDVWKRFPHRKNRISKIPRKHKKRCVEEISRSEEGGSSFEVVDWVDRVGGRGSHLVGSDIKSSNGPIKYTVFKASNSSLGPIQRGTSESGEDESSSCPVRYKAFKAGGVNIDAVK